MSSSSKSPSITLNPAFLQEIKESNVSLWNDLKTLEGLCQTRPLSSGFIRRLAPMLVVVRDSLSLQFGLEDAYGYFVGPASVGLRIAERAAAARAQHCSLYLLLSELCERAEDLQFRGPTSDALAELMADANDFLGQLQQHEHEETTLIELAYHEQVR